MARYTHSNQHAHPMVVIFVFSLVMLTGIAIWGTFNQKNSPQTFKSSAASNECTSNIHCGAGSVCRQRLCVNTTTVPTKTPTRVATRTPTKFKSPTPQAAARYKIVNTKQCVSLTVGGNFRRKTTFYENFAGEYEKIGETSSRTSAAFCNDGKVCSPSNACNINSDSGKYACQNQNLCSNTEYTNVRNW